MEDEKDGTGEDIGELSGDVFKGDGESKMAGADDWGRSMNPRGNALGWWVSRETKGRKERHGADASWVCRRVVARPGGEWGRGG